MEFAMYMYLIHVMSAVNTIVTVLLIFMMIVTLCLMIFIMISASENCFNDETKALYKRYLKISIVTTAVFATLTSAIPNERMMYLMAGAYAAQEVVTSEPAKKVLQIIDLKLEEELKKIQEAK